MNTKEVGVQVWRGEHPGSSLMYTVHVQWKRRLQVMLRPGGARMGGERKSLGWVDRRRGEGVEQQRYIIHQDAVSYKQ